MTRPFRSAETRERAREAGRKGGLKSRKPEPSWHDTCHAAWIKMIDDDEQALFREWIRLGDKTEAPRREDLKRRYESRRTYGDVFGLEFLKWHSRRELARRLEVSLLKDFNRIVSMSRIRQFLTDLSRQKI